MKDSFRINFSIPGKPKAKGRPQFTVRGKFAKAYTPLKTVSWEQVVRTEFELAALQQEIKLPIVEHGPVHILVIAYFQAPESWPKWKTALAEKETIFHTSQPDADNVLKIILDALNTVAFRDDRTVARMQVSKRWSLRPRTEVYLKYESEQRRTKKPV